MGNDGDSSDQRSPRSVGEQHGVALVLAEDGAGQTRPEAGRRLGGALTAKKTAPAVRRQLGAEAVARRRGGSGSDEHRWRGRARALVQAATSARRRQRGKGLAAMAERKR
jgi:hypothetical protein